METTSQSVDRLIAERGAYSVAGLEKQLAPVTTALVTHPKTAADLAVANEQFIQLKDIEKRLLDREREILGPLNEAIRSVRAMFAPLKDRLTKAITDLRFGLAEYNARTTATLEKLDEKLERKVHSGLLTRGQASHELAKAGEKAGTGALATREHKTVVVTDPEKVPDLYWTIDMVHVRKDALAGRTIPGVEVKVEQIVVKPR